MKKRVLATVLAVCMIFSCLAVSAAKYTSEADTLKSLGLFLGTDQGYELDRAPSRIEAGVMLVRLLGKESVALNGTDEHPFSDVPEWAAKYVAYMHQTGLTKGVSDTEYGSSLLCNSAMYTTFVLRALGYSDSDGDFTYEKSLDFAMLKNLVSSTYGPTLKTKEFLRDDVVKLSYNAVLAPIKASDKTLLEKLVDENAVPTATANKYLDVIRADELFYAAFYKNVEKNSRSYTSTEDIKWVSEGYSPVSISIESKVKEVYTNSSFTVENKEKYTTPNGVEEYSIYVTDEWRYTLAPDGSKTKEKLESGISTGTPTEPLPLLNTYSSANIIESSGKTSVELVLSSEYADQEIKSFLKWFLGSDYPKNDDDVVISAGKCTESYTINDEGYLENLKTVLNFDYIIPGDVKTSIEVTTNTVYKDLGKEITITLPDDLDSYTEKKN